MHKLSTPSLLVNVVRVTPLNLKWKKHHILYVFLDFGQNFCCVISETNFMMFLNVVLCSGLFFFLYFFKSGRNAAAIC